MNFKRLLGLLLLLGLGSGAPAVVAAGFDADVQRHAYEVLQAGLHGDAFWPAMHAAEALTIAGQGDEVRRVLLPRLDVETDDQRRCGLARELVRAGDRSRAIVLFSVLDSPDPHGHVHAAESLYKVGWRGSGAALWSAYEQVENPRLKVLAAAALAKHGPMAEREAPLRYLRSHFATSSDPADYRLSAWVLARVGSDEDIPLIRSRLGGSHDARVETMLQHALAALGDAEGREALLRNLRSPDSSIRIFAAVFAGEAGIVAAEPQLITQLYDADLDARIRAAQALFTLRQ